MCAAKFNRPNPPPPPPFWTAVNIRYLKQHGIKMPVRPHAGPNRGNLEWRRPTRDAVNTVLRHHLYAGTYRYGYRQTDSRRKDPEKPGSGRVVMDPEDYHALIPNRCPAYITMERYERNQKRIIDNQFRAAYKGAPRDGPSLLSGVAYCGRCGRRLAVHYSGKEGTLRYECWYSKNTCDGPICQSFSGKPLDELVSEKIMSALEPAALELSLRAADDLQNEREQVDRNWKQRLERCRYEAERTERQYRVVEPENRLVGRELERQWEAALQELQQLEKEYARVRQAQPANLTDKERDTIRSLSRNLPLLWNAPTTTSSDRQRIVRLLLERVVVQIQGSSDRADVTLQWAGGFNSQHELVRPVLRYDQTVDYERLLGRIEDLRRQGWSFAKIAEQLNQEGFRPVKMAEKFHSDLVSRLVRKLRNQQPDAKVQSHREFLKDGEWLAIDLASKLEMPKNTLFSWIRRGWVHVVRQLPGYRGRTICWADAAELNRLGQLRQTKHGWWDPPLAAELTTPKVPQTPAAGA